MGKILEITEKVPKPAKLEDGLYQGTWGGSIIEIRVKDKLYQLKTDEGVRGMGFKVLVTIKDGIGTFEEMKN